jgi:broad specificity phosphatase PhoE
MMITRICFVRHGDVDNPQQVFYGRLPGFGLSKEGHQQAHAAAVALCKEPIAAIYTSELQRARETADEIHALCPDLQPIPSPLLLEVYSPYDGTPRHEMVAHGWDLYKGIPPEYEQPADVLARARRFIARVRVRHAGQHVVAVTHGDVIAFLTLWAYGYPVAPRSRQALRKTGIPEGYPAHGSITTLSYRGSEDGERPAMEHVVPYSP